MCEPTTLLMASMAISATSQIAGYAGQASSASAQSKYQNERYASVSRSALDSYFLEINSTGQRAEQEFQAAANEDQQIRDAGQAERGALAARASSSGVSGNSIDALMRSFSAVEYTNHRINATNLTWKNQQLQQGLAGYAAQTQQYISNAAPAPVQRPSTAGLLLGLGTTAIDGALRYSTMNPSTPTPTSRPDSYVDWRASGMPRPH